jgi:hypothetical protein
LIKILRSCFSLCHFCITVVMNVVNKIKTR